VARPIGHGSADGRDARCRPYAGEFSRETSHKIDASDEFVDLDELVRLMRLADPAGFAYDMVNR